MARARAAFYAPLKPPDHPAPSGDRRIARLFMDAFRRIDVTPELASRFRSRDAAGDTDRQARMAALGPKLAARALCRLGPERADVWFTYHLYYKAADWFGPEAAARLGVPYVVAEASYAPKRAGGPWDLSHRRVAAAVGQAAAVLCLNPNDKACLAPLVRDERRLVDFPPFLDMAPYAAARPARAELARAHGLPEDDVWLLAVGMMREGDKAASYLALADALERMRPRRSWRLIVLGDGPAKSKIETRLRQAAGDRVVFGGILDEAALARYYASADILAWPAVREAFGMALLEAQASGLPVVAGDVGGVGGVVEHGVSGLLTPPDDTEAFAAALASLIDDDDRRQAFGAAATARVAAKQSLDAAARRLEAALERIHVL